MTLRPGIHVVDYLAVEDGLGLASALRQFCADILLDRTMIVELIAEVRPNGSEVSMLRLRPAEPINN